MRRILFIFFWLMLIAVPAFSQDSEIHWYTIDEAEELMKKEPKKIFVDIYTDWCGWCKRMDQTTFKDTAIVKYMNENYYPVKFDAEQKDSIYFNNFSFLNRREGRRPPHDFAVSILDGKMSYPSYVFLDEEYKRLRILPGYQQPGNLEELLKYYSENKYKKMTLEEYRNSQ